MKRLCVVLVVITSCCGLVVAQDLPPDILADQYLLEATEALENGDVQNAVSAFQKIESLDIEPPLEYLFFYGKFLAEHSTSLDELNKGQSLLKKYVIKTGKDSEHYKSTLQLLSVVGRKVEEAKRLEEAVKALLVDGVDVNVKLRDAAFKDNSEAVKVLIAAGADVNAKSKTDYTPLYSAARNGNLEVVKLLITAGADVNANTGGYGYALFGAVFSLSYTSKKGNKPEVVKLLITAGADVNVKNEHGETPLYYVGSNLEVVKLLIAAGADVNAKSKTGYTPLHSVVRYYMSGPYNFKYRSAVGYNRSVTMAIIKLLITAGADVNAKTVTGDRPLEDLVSMKYGTTDYPELVAILRAAGARCNYDDHQDYLRGY